MSALTSSTSKELEDSVPTITATSSVLKTMPCATQDNDGSQVIAGSDARVAKSMSILSIISAAMRNLIIFLYKQRKYTGAQKMAAVKVTP